MKPIGAIVIDKNGARVEGLRGNAATLVEAISEAVADVRGRPATREGDAKK